MNKTIEPTDPGHELLKGRIALWLGADDLDHLSKHCCCSEDTSNEQTERCGRIRFRARAALHKADVQLKAKDLLLLANAINEILNGPNAIPDWEFNTRLGADRDSGVSLQQVLSALLSEVEGES